MECPYCKRKMKSGTIQADNLLAWTPEGESSAGVTRWSKSKNAVVLANYYLLAPASVAAFYCEGCGKIIISVDGKK